MLRPVYLHMAEVDPALLSCLIQQLHIVFAKRCKGMLENIEALIDRIGDIHRIHQWYLNIVHMLNSKSADLLANRKVTVNAIDVFSFAMKSTLSNSDRSTPSSNREASRALEKLRNPASNIWPLACPLNRFINTF